MKTQKERTQGMINKMRMKVQRLNVFLVLILFGVLSGCGTTSALRTQDSKVLPNLSKYTQVVVLDFKDGTMKNIKDEKKHLAYQEAVMNAGKNFADRIASEIRKTTIFTEVSRAQLTEDAIVISGVITRYEEGSSAMRFWVGMGAGSSYLDAEVNFDDNLNHQELGTIKVDKNSWFLGGGLASGQTVEAFMQVAAQKIAKELVRAKTTVPAQGL